MKKQPQWFLIGIAVVIVWYFGYKSYRVQVSCTDGEPFYKAEKGEVWKVMHLFDLMSSQREFSDKETYNKFKVGKINKDTEIYILETAYEWTKVATVNPSTFKFDLSGWVYIDKIKRGRREFKKEDLEKKAE